MTARAFSARGGTLRSLAAITCVMAGLAFAQDPRAVMVQNTAREWLAQTDRLDAAASFAAAGEKFRAPITVEEWAGALTKARAPLGAVVQRTMIDTAFERGAPAGGSEMDIAMVVFRTAFAQKAISTETITLAKDADGAWRVIGYFIR